MPGVNPGGEAVAPREQQLGAPPAPRLGWIDFDGAGFGRVDFGGLGQVGRMVIDGFAAAVLPGRRPPPVRATPSAMLSHPYNKARRTLMSCLNVTQRATFRRTGRFDVVGSAGGRYRVRLGWSGNVFSLDEAGREIRSYCAHPREPIPDPDVALGQYLMLVTDEPRFLNTAYAWPVARWAS